MDLLKGIDDIGFDIEKAREAVEHYSRSTGVQCSIIDTYGAPLWCGAGEGDVCVFCAKAHEIMGSADYCSRVHLYGSYQAERFGGKYIFFCPMGLVHWASPISAEGMMKGAVLCGPVLMVEPEEFLIDDLIRKNNISESKVDELKVYLKEIPIVPPERVTSLSELLFMVTAHISDTHNIHYMDEAELQEQQSNISGYIHYIKTMGGDDQGVKAYPLEKEKELLSLIAIGDKKGSQKVLNEILGHIFFSTGGNFQVIKARVLELIVLLSRAALEGGADVEQIFGLNYKYLNTIHNFRTVEELTYWLSKIMVRFTDCVFNLKDIKHVDVIYKAIDYINRNYMKKISLEEVASHVYLSPSYFSKVFKDEMKCNFNTYVNQVRIEKSKQLLLNDSINLVDVSNMVGYEDQSYFSKVFKKNVGVSPGKFRESRGQHKFKEVEL